MIIMPIFVIFICKGLKVFDDLGKLGRNFKSLFIIIAVVGSFGHLFYSNTYRDVGGFEVKCIVTEDHSTATIPRGQTNGCLLFHAMP